MGRLASIFTRAWAQKYLAPWERAVYKLAEALLVLVPSSLLVTGVSLGMSDLHANVPAWFWSVLGVLIPALLLAAAKYASAKGDTAVGAILQQLEQEAAQAAHDDAPR